uniref:Uncharacterized protein n=1 Tax=viral metagenome TaxID=1070528 RepID=A0A6M3J2L4_9ZZZZ
MTIFKSRKRIITVCYYGKLGVERSVIYVVTYPIWGFPKIRKGVYMFDTVYFLIVGSHFFRLHIHYPVWM